MAAAVRIPWGAEPKCFPHDRPAESPLLAPHEEDYEHELPDQAAGEQEEERLHQGHVCLAAEVVVEGRSGEPSQGPHREGCSRPDGEDRPNPVLGDLDLGNGCLGA